MQLVAEAVIPALLVFLMVVVGLGLTRGGTEVG